MATGVAQTIDKMLREAAGKLEGFSPSARLDAEVLLGHVLSCSRLQLVMNAHDPVSPEAGNRFFELIARRVQYEPVAYLVGHKEFYGLELHVTPDVLVPRPETEILVEAVLNHARSRNGAIRLLDLGTGSGAIPVALAVTLRQEGRDCSIVALDRSAAALSVARSNAERHGVQDVIEFLESNWFAAVADDRVFDIIVSNPPYIAEDDCEVSPELVFEPRTALYSGEQGLSDIGLILSAVSQRTHLPELLLIEIGMRQGELLTEKLTSGDFGACFRQAQIEILRDLAGLSRLLMIRNIPGK